ncbi:MAG: DUF3467 domain-containing protein [Deltaproteobacteria bacterium]|nr:DUF3467 domain-containing protein [Deltaproteobacteria bacterium]
MAKRQISQVQPKEEVTLRLRWQDASDLPTLYANQVYVSHAGGEFYVVFGEVQQPILLNLTPDDLQKMGEIQVKPVAKLVFTPEAMASVLKALTDNVGSFKQRQERQEEGER